jgi:hypothetical protein
MELTPERLLVLGSVIAGIIFTINRGRKIVQPEPTLQQWVNRLIEYFDKDHVPVAFQRFSYLVQSGIEPEHAFEITIRS